MGMKVLAVAILASLMVILFLTLKTSNLGDKESSLVLVCDGSGCVDTALTKIDCPFSYTEGIKIFTCNPPDGTTLLKDVIRNIERMNE